MEVFAFGSLGLLLGIVLCAISFAAFLLYRTAVNMTADSVRMQQLVADHAGETTKAVLSQLTQNTQQMHKLQTEVSAALTKLDAAQLHESALQIQRSGARLARTVSMLYKLALSQDGSSGIAAAELAEEDVDPLSGKSYVDTFSPQDASAYQAHLAQRAQEKSHLAEVIPTNPLPDIQEGHDLDERETLAEFFPDGL